MLIAGAWTAVCGGSEPARHFRRSKPCTLCGFAPVSIANQAVMRGVAGVAVAGKVVVAADAANHRVLIWRSTTPSPGIIGAKQPDVVFTKAGTRFGGL